ncbi:hypothetical protein TcCL_NonESM11674 [Trypanosoma cruzi]|nr:hypothetical protein TcCL_NonESM11674 [Trypanosoma cruzi]
MHHGNPTNKRVQFACFMENICNARVKKECRDAAFHIAFAIHVSLGSTQPPLLRSAPVLLASLHWRKLSPHIPLTVHCGIQTYHTAWVRCHPANKSQDLPTASCGTGGSSIIMPAKGFFSQSRTRPHHTPVKTFGPSHAKEWSGRTAGKTTPAAMSSPHTPTHRCPAYHQK